MGGFVFFMSGFNNPKFVVVSVTDGGDTVTVWYASSVELHIQPKTFRSACHLHRTGDTTILVSASSHKIRAAVHNKVDMLLQPKDMFCLQQTVS